MRDEFKSTLASLCEATSPIGHWIYFPLDQTHLFDVPFSHWSITSLSHMNEWAELDEFETASFSFFRSSSCCYEFSETRRFTSSPKSHTNEIWYVHWLNSIVSCDPLLSVFQSANE